MKRVLERGLSFLLAAALLANAAPWAYAAETTEEEVPVSEEIFEEGPAPEAPEAAPEEEPVQLLADTLTTADGYAYTVANGAVTITGYTGSATELTIPAKIDGLPVTTIGANAFSDHDNLTKITIPEGVTTLHQFCFGYMDETELTVHIPNSLTEYKGGYGAFYGSNIKEVVFADGITSILTRLFGGAKFQGALTLPDTVAAIGQSAFAETTGLTAVTLPKGLTEIGQSVFFQSRDLASVSIPNTVTVIRSDAFDSSGLTSIDLPKNLVEIGPYAFSDCDSLTDVVLPDALAKLGNYAFAYCDDLESLTAAGTDLQIQIERDILYGSSNATVFASDRSALAVYAVENGNPLSLFLGNSPRGLLADHSTYLINTSTAIGGNYLGATVKYGFQNPEEITWARLELMIPTSTLLSENSVRVNGERVQYNEGNNGILNIDVPKEGGRVELSLRILSSGDIRTYAILHTDLGSEILRVISEPLPEVTISVPERTHENSVTVTGFARPGAQVALYVDETLQKTADANKAGTYSATLTLPVKNADQAQIFDIKAVSGEGYARSQLRYAKDTPQLVEFLMYYNNHQNTVLNLLNQTTRPHISFNPAYDITLTAKFENGERIDKVWFTTSRGGITNAIPAELIGDRYVAVLTQDDYNGTPGTLAVEYSLKREQLLMDKAASDLTPVVEAAKDLIGSNTTSRPLTEEEVTVPDGLTFDEENSQEITVDFGSALGLSPALTGVLRVEQYQSSGSYPNGVLNANISAADSTIPIAGIPSLGLTMHFRSSSGMMQPYQQSASGTDGYNRFTVQDTAGKRYNIMYKATGAASDDHPVEDFVCIVEKIGTSDVVKFVVEAGANTPEGTAAIAQALEEAGAFYEAVGVVYDLYQIDKDYQELEEQIRQNFHGEEQKEALKKAKELRSNRQDFTLMMAAIGGGLAAAGMMSGPPGWAMAALLFAMSASSEFFWETRTNNILGGSFGADYIIDPSGYVYEAVTTNRVEGVEATAYWIPEPEDGLDTFYANAPVGDDARQLVWDAEDYDQMNPLYTDSNGAYAWDVPAGWWRVMYKKEGYTTTYSDWLPVPPPQLEVNVPITSYEAPVLESVKAETDHVEVTFSKYMQPETVKTALTLNGQAAAVSCTLEEGFARTFTLTPETPLAENSEVTVAVTAEAKSYAGTAAAASTMEAKVGGTPKLELRSTVQVLLGGSVRVPFVLKNTDAAVTAVSGLQAIAAVRVEDGALVVTGTLPGTATVTVTAGELTAELQVQVVRELSEPELQSPLWKNNSVTVSVSVDQPATVVAAVYGPGGRFVGLGRKPVRPGENQPVTVSDLPEGVSCKVFLLDGSHGPLCKAKDAAR